MPWGAGFSGLPDDEDATASSGVDVIESIAGPRATPFDAAAACTAVGAEPFPFFVSSPRPTPPTPMPATVPSPDNNPQPIHVRKAFLSYPILGNELAPGTAHLPRAAKCCLLTGGLPVR